MIEIKKLVSGVYQANIYLVINKLNNKAIIIDSGDGSTGLNEFKEFIGQTEPTTLINTHGHLDHIAGNDLLIDNFKLQAYIHKDDNEKLYDPVQNLSQFIGKPIKEKTKCITLTSDTQLQINELNINILNVPGHTPGGICIVIEDCIFTGDTLFRECVGRSDFPGGNHNLLVKSIKEKLLVLPENYKVYPGHDEESTIGYEKQNNPYLQA